MKDRERTKLQNAVVRGVKLLDKTDADWWKKKNGTVFPGSIDVDNFDMASGSYCVLGQLDGYYHTGRERLWGHLDRDKAQIQAVRYGFDAGTIGGYKGYSVLGECWLDVIRCRRSPRRKRPEWMMGRLYI